MPRAIKLDAACLYCGQGLAPKELCGCDGAARIARLARVHKDDYAVVSPILRRVIRPAPTSPPAETKP